MCGIAGLVYKKALSLQKEEVLNQMLEQIAHRGKDNRGTFFAADEHCEIALGHNRLSIIDTSDRANQPYHFEELSLVFNGEIYNYQELWPLLKSNGYTIETTSDTEVILKLFHLYREKAFSYLNGMFAIAICDHAASEMYLVRDRLGVKPLVYYKDERHFYFSSEQKSFYKGIPADLQLKIRPDMIANYFQFGYVNSFDSVFTNIHKVKNGSVVKLSMQNFQLSEHDFWQLESGADEDITDISKAYDKIKPIVETAVKYRLVSDVGFGVFLSSGIDSNLVMSILLTEKPARVDSYTYQGVESKSNEQAQPYQTNAVNQVNVSLTDATLWDDYKKLCSAYDEPFSDPATVGLYGLSRKAREENRVILVGDGGDELLGGYMTYEQLYYYTRPNFGKGLLRFLYKPFSPLLWWFFRKYPFAKRTDRIYLYHTLLSHNNLFDVLQALDSRYNGLIEHITKVKIPDTPIEAGKKNSIISFLNYKTGSELIHQLNYKTDIAGMLNTIEIREPLLDYRLFELQQHFSDNIFFDKSKGITNKYLYRKILDTYNPDMRSPKKTGFKVDIDRVFRQHSNEIDTLFESYTSEYIDADLVRDIWNKYKSDRANFTIMNRIISFILWENNLMNRI